MSLAVTFITALILYWAVGLVLLSSADLAVYVHSLKDRFIAAFDDTHYEIRSTVEGSFENGAERGRRMEPVLAALFWGSVPVLAAVVFLSERDRARRDRIRAQIAENERLIAEHEKFIAEAERKIEENNRMIALLVLEERRIKGELQSQGDPEDPPL